MMTSPPPMQPLLCPLHCVKGMIRCWLSYGKSRLK